MRGWIVEGRSKLRLVQILEKTYRFFPHRPVMPSWSYILFGFVLASTLMFVLYRKAVRVRDAGWVDVGWAGSMGLVAIAYALVLDGWWPRKILVGLMVSMWAFRLAFFIFRRLGNGEEDGRYQSLRAHWGDRADQRFFWFFQGQALLVVFFSIPFFVAMSVPTARFTLLDGLGVLIWLVAVLGETVADAQLSRFRADPSKRGRVCRTGLWNYSRHPNYFFEWLHWWTYVAVAVTSPWGGLTLLGPALMFLFLFKLTGIPYTEKQALLTRGDAYRDYQETTSAFFPWFPKPRPDHDPPPKLG